MARLFASGHAADIVLLFMIVEAGWLVGRGRAAGEVVATLLPGALMVIAVRAALVGAAWPWVALPLTLSLPAHLAYLRRRGWLGPVRTASSDRR